ASEVWPAEVHQSKKGVHHVLVYRINPTRCYEFRRRSVSKKYVTYECVDCLKRGRGGGCRPKCVFSAGGPSAPALPSECVVNFIEDPRAKHVCARAKNPPGIDYRRMVAFRDGASSSPSFPSPAATATVRTIVLKRLANDEMKEKMNGEMETESVNIGINTPPSSTFAKKIVSQSQSLRNQQTASGGSQQRPEKRIADDGSAMVEKVRRKKTFMATRATVESDQPSSSTVHAALAANPAAAAAHSNGFGGVSTSSSRRSHNSVASYPGYDSSLLYPSTPTTTPSRGLSHESKCLLIDPSGSPTNSCLPVPPPSSPSPTEAMFMERDGLGAASLQETATTASFDGPANIMSILRATMAVQQMRKEEGTGGEGEEGEVRVEMEDEQPQTTTHTRSSTSMPVLTSMEENESAAALPSDDLQQMGLLQQLQQPSFPLSPTIQQLFNGSNPFSTPSPTPPIDLSTTTTSTSSSSPPLSHNLFPLPIMTQAGFHAMLQAPPLQQLQSRAAACATPIPQQQQASTAPSCIMQQPTQTPPLLQQPLQATPQRPWFAAPFPPEQPTATSILSQSHHSLSTPLLQQTQQSMASTSLASFMGNMLNPSAPFMAAGAATPQPQPQPALPAPPINVFAIYDALTRQQQLDAAAARAAELMEYRSTARSMEDMAAKLYSLTPSRRDHVLNTIRMIIDLG
ncbi:hypothetical protein PFISCL1PPCAC_10915, partial [Pristionchus fissidentatus]